MVKYFVLDNAGMCSGLNFDNFENLIIGYKIKSEETFGLHFQNKSVLLCNIGNLCIELEHVATI